MAGNGLIFKRALYQIMEEKERRPGLHFFNLGPKGDCTTEQVIRIRQLFINQLKQDTCLECCRCHALLAKVVFVEQECNSFCISCFEKEPELMQGAFMFVNLNLDDPSFGDEWIWKYSEELQLVYKAHEFGVEDMALLANSMTLGKTTAQDIRDYFYVFGGFKHRQPKVAALNAPVQEKKEEAPVKKKKETYLQLFTRLKNMLEELDSGMLYYLMSELHDRIDQEDNENKQYLLKEFVKIINFREQFYPFLEKLCKEYMARKYAISSSSSESVGDSYKPEEDKRRKKEIATKRSKQAREIKEVNEDKETKQKKKSIRAKEKAIKKRTSRAKTKQTKTKKISRKASARQKSSSVEKTISKGSKKLLKKQPSARQGKKFQLMIESEGESD